MSDPADPPWGRREPMTPERIGPYVVEKLLGRGGMGEVYQAWDEKLERHVAIKRIRSSAMRSETLRHFLREARTAAQLSHPSIVRIYHVEELGRDDCIVMELIDGRPLSTLIRSGPLEAAACLALACQIADGLAEAHSKGIIHRDLKTENVMVTAEGRAKILDFGLAKPLVSVRKDSMSDKLIGTPRAMSPEQANEQPLDPRSDLFSFGTLLYEVSTGQTPFRGRTPLAVLHQVCHHQPPQVRKVNPDVPVELSSLIARMMEKRAEDRPQNAVEVREALARISSLEGAPALRAGRTWSHTPILHDERRQVTVLCSRFGAAELGAVPSVVASNFLNRAGELVQRHLGSVVKATPGELIACFGYPRAYGDDACRAVRAAFAILALYRSDLAERDSQLLLRLALHTGVAEISGQGSGPARVREALDETADPWLRAARILEACEPGAVWLSPETRGLVESAFDCEGPYFPSRSPLGGPGESSPGAVHRVRGLVDRRGASLSEDTSTLVARRKELELVEERWRLAREGRGQVVLVSGDAGIGKTRLLASFAERLGPDSADAWTCRSSPQFQDSALRPAIALLWQVLATGRGARPEEHCSRLEELAARYGLEAHLPYLANLLGLPLAREDVPSSANRQVRTIDAVLELLLALAAERPRVWIVEDLHWTDPSTLDLLDRLIDQVPTSPLLLLLSVRSQFRLPWNIRSWVTPLVLTNLSLEDTKKLVRMRAGGLPMTAELVDRIAALTDGVPLFVEELTRLVLDSWPRGDHAADPGGRLAVPTNLRDALTARLDGLGEAKQLAQLAAVFGRDFSRSLLEALAPFDEETLECELGRLEESELLYRKGITRVMYHFKHALIREVAYESIPQARRRSYHGRIARTLEDEFSETVRLHPEVLAHHYAEAGEIEEAVRWWLHAGQKAWATVEAARHLGRGLALVATMPESAERHRLELRYHAVLGPVLMAARGFGAPEVKRSYDRVLELVRLLGEEPDFKTLWGYWRFYATVGEWGKALELARRLEQAAEASGSPTELAVALRSVGSVLFHMGKPREARQILERCITLDEGDGECFSYVHHPRVNCQAYAAWILWQLGFPDQALTIAQESLELARRLEEPYTLALALATACLIYRLRGENGEVLALSAEQIELAREHDFRLPLAGAKLFHGGALASAGSPEEGLAEMREGLREWRATRASASLTFILADVAETCLDSKDAESGLEALDDAVRVVEAGGERFYGAELARLRGELLLLGGDEEAADRHFVEASEIAERQGALSFELRASLSRGRLLRRQGREDEAVRVVDGVRRRFTEGFASADLREAAAFS